MRHLLAIVGYLFDLFNRRRIHEKGDRSRTGFDQANRLKRVFGELDVPLDRFSPGGYVEGLFD